MSDFAYLLFRFDGTWTCDDLEITSADLNVRSDLHYSVLRMEFPVGVLVRFLDTLYCFDDIQRLDEIDVH